MLNRLLYHQHYITNVTSPTLHAVHQRWRCWCDSNWLPGIGTSNRATHYNLCTFCDAQFEKHFTSSGRLLFGM